MSKLLFTVLIGPALFIVCAVALLCAIVWDFFFPVWRRVR